MASPQRPIPDEQQREEPQREFQKIEGGRKNRPSRPRRSGFAWWWAVWVAIFGVVGWWAVWGWDGTGGYWRTRVLHIPPAGAHVTLPSVSGSGLAALNAANKQPFLGKKFHISNVPVQARVNQHVFWIGAKNSTPMLMVMQGKGNTGKNGTISKGTLVDVTGTVKKAPPASKARSQWSLSSAGVARLEQQKAYIQAKQAFWVPK